MAKLWHSGNEEVVVITIPKHPARKFHAVFIIIYYYFTIH
jgi:hypothetical protein